MARKILQEIKEQIDIQIRRYSRTRTNNTTEAMASYLECLFTIFYSLTCLSFSTISSPPYSPYFVIRLFTAQCWLEQSPLSLWPLTLLCILCTLSKSRSLNSIALIPMYYTVNLETMALGRRRQIIQKAVKKEHSSDSVPYGSSYTSFAVP